MAVFRKIRIDFWQDRYVLKLAPEQKYFFLYLLSNPHTRQSGIYEISIDIIAFETGLDEKKVSEYIQKFCKDGKIKFNKKNSEIMISNWLKNNPATSPKISACIRDEIVDVKTKSFVESLYRLFMRYRYNTDIVFQEEEEEKKEKKEKKEKFEEGEVIEEEETLKKNENHEVRIPSVSKESDRIENEVSSSKPNPLIEIAELCYKKQGEDCKLKLNSKGLEQKCYVCFNMRKNWK